MNKIRRNMLKRLMVCLILSGLLLVGCGSKKADYEQTETKYDGYEKINNVYFKIDGYSFSYENEGTNVYFNDDKTKCLSVCVKPNEGSKKGDIEALYDSDLAGYYGNEYDGYTYTSDSGNAWKIYDYTKVSLKDGMKLCSCLLPDEKYIIYIENQVYEGEVNYEELFAVLNSFKLEE